MRLLRAILLAAIVAQAAVAAAAEPAPAAAGTDFDSALMAQLEASRSKRSGLMFYVGGQAIPGVVKEILPDAVVVTNREYGTVVIRLDRIDAAAAN